MSLSMSKVRVLIVEDHALLIDGIHNLLAKQHRYEVVGTESNGLEVYHACQRLTPDIVLLDLSLPGMDGVDIIHQLRRRWDSLRIVVLTASSDLQRAQAALTAGANAYVLKMSSQQVLLTALQHAALGRVYTDPALKLESLESRDPVPGMTPLTLRERQVLKLVAEGHRNISVAQFLSISLKTVETHRMNLMRKLDAHNAATLSNWARKLGVLEV